MSTHDGKIAARLQTRIEVSDGLAIFRFELEREFHFIPGQYATLWFSYKGKTLARPYSIASNPAEKRVLEFYINLVREGKLTPSLWTPQFVEALLHGDAETRVMISGPRGRFVLEADDPRDLVLVSSGTGVAPFISMIRKLNDDFLSSPRTFHLRRIYLIHGVSCPIHLGFRKELEGLAAETLRDPKRRLVLLYLPTISRPFMDSTWTGLKGRAETLLDFPSSRASIDTNLEDTIKAILATIVQPHTHAVYVCGHPGTVDGLVSTMSRRGFRVDTDIKREKYYP